MYYDTEYMWHGTRTNQIRSCRAKNLIPSAVRKSGKWIKVATYRVDNPGLHTTVTDSSGNVLYDNTVRDVVERDALAALITNYLNSLDGETQNRKSKSNSHSINRICSNIANIANATKRRF